MKIGDKVRIIDGYYEGKTGSINEIIELEVFEDVIMVNLGTISVSTSEKQLELIK